MATLHKECPCCRRPLVVSEDMILSEDWGYVIRAGHAVYLTREQTRLLKKLWERRPNLVSKDVLYDAMYWRRAEAEEPAPKIIDVWVCKLRPLLEPLGLEIITHWGRGYSLHVEPLGEAAE